MSRGALLRLAAFPVVVWLMVVVGMAALQRGMIFPAPSVSPELLHDLATQRGAVELKLRTEDDEQLYGWRVMPARRTGPLVVYFSGNGSTVGGDPARLGALVAAGAEVLHVNYRGYPGSTGTPSEVGLRADARAVWAEARRSHQPSEIVLMGKSLGGGVALGLAAELSEGGQTPLALVVESTFRSVADVAAQAYPWLPVRRLLRHPFDSISLAPQVGCPSLVLHGADDDLIDVQHGRDLAVALPGARLVGLSP